MMKFNVILFLILPVLSALADDPPKAVIRGISPCRGEIYLAVFREASTYMKMDSAYRREMQPASADSVVFSLEGLPEGDYAISVFHDANGNTVLDAGELGIPKESFGFSNNPRSFFGPPGFAQAVIHISPGDIFTIDLVNIGRQEVTETGQEKMTKKELRKEKRKQRRQR
jgi:uncharacterized protein (DUF2141 family)